MYKRLIKEMAGMLKGGPGSGPQAGGGDGPVTISGKPGAGLDTGRGYKIPDHLRETFNAGTQPLRRSLKLDDQVAFLDNGKLRIAQVDFGGDKDTLSLKDYSTGEKFKVPKTEARMPKGGYRTRGE